VLGRLIAFAKIVDPGEFVNGADDGVPGDLDVFGALDDVAEREAEVAIATWKNHFEKAGIVDVHFHGQASSFDFCGNMTVGRDSH
jgi:hypothetical protein